MRKIWIFGVVILLAAVFRPQGADAGQIVFDNYGPAWSHHDEYGWTVSGLSSWAHQEYHEAAPFVAACGGRVTDLWLTLAYSEGGNEVDVWLADDDAGLPGTILDTWMLVDAIPPHGPHPLTPVHLDPASGPTLVAGRTYWLGVSPRTDDLYAMWYWNPSDASGSNALRLGDTGDWTLQSPVSTAVFRIEAAPEPATWVLMGLGTTGLWFCRRRRK